MSSLGVCDHCGRTLKTQELHSGTVSGFWSEDYDIDLCSDCRGKLDDWLNPEASRRLKEYLKGDKKT